MNQLKELLKKLGGLKVECPKCDQPASPNPVNTGEKSQFIFAHSEANKRTRHGGSTRVPSFKPVEA